MPLNTRNNTNYDFNRPYEDLPTVNLPVRVLDRNTTAFLTTSAYSNSQDVLTVYPYFEDTTTTFPELNGLSATPIIDNYRYFMDMGDGTIINDLTATHYYKYPGEYQITLVAVDSGTNFYMSNQRPVVKVYNVVPDMIFMTYLDDNTVTSSTLHNPILITRFNSYQSWPAVSANGGYTLNLTVSGNESDFTSSDEYYSNVDAHLEKNSMFVQAVDGEATVVDSVMTTTDPIYGTRVYSSSIFDYALHSTPVEGSIFLGTSGTSIVYYYED